MKPQGRRGEVAAQLFTDFPELFSERRRVFLLRANGSRIEQELEDFWPHQGRVVLKFLGVDSISAAEELAGSEVQVPRSERAALEPGAEYVSDLVGSTVFDLGASSDRSPEVEVGKISAVEFGAGDAPVLVVKSGEREYLIPFAAEYLKAVDVKRKRVEMVLPPGMLEVNAPSGKDDEPQGEGAGRQPRRIRKAER